MQYAHTLYTADSLEKALVAYQKVAYAKFDGSLLVDSLSGYALHRMGVCAYYLSKSEDAKRYYQGAIAVRDVAFAKPHNEQAKSRVNLARVFIEQGALDSAAYYLHAAIERLEVTALPDFSLYETVLTELIQVASGLGDSQMALAAARRARFIFENFHGSIAADKAAMMYYDISVSLLYLDQFEQSKLHALAALDINQGLGDNRRVGLCYQSLAAIAERSNNFQDAIQYLQLALVFTLTEDQQSLSYLHHSLARNQLHLGNLPAAETHLRTAEANVPPGDLLHSHNAKLRALLLAASGKPAPALKFFNTAVALLDSSGTYEGDLLVVHPPAVIEANLDLLALHLTDRAAFLADQGRYRDALRDYGTVLQIRERLRRDVSSGGSRERLSTNLRPLLDDAIEVCHRLYKQGQEEMAWQALQFSEWARAYDLLRSYRRGGAANVEMEPWSKIAKLERQVVMDSTVQTALSDARLRLDRLVRRQGIHDTTALQPLDHDRLQNYLSQHHARLLLYHLTDSSAYRFALAEDGQLALERLPVVGAELTEAVIQWRTDIAESAYRRKSMRNGQDQEALDRSYLTDGQQLAAKLDLRAGALPTILIPDGILHALPFAALPLGQATAHTLHYDSIDYLGDHAPLSFGYSIATLLAQEEPRPDTYSLDLLAFAPAFAPNTLPLLPLSHEEAAAVCDHYTSHELLVDGQANRTNFTTRRPLPASYTSPPTARLTWKTPTSATSPSPRPAAPVTPTNASTTTSSPPCTCRPSWWCCRPAKPASASPCPEKPSPVWPPPLPPPGPTPPSLRCGRSTSGPRWNSCGTFTTGWRRAAGGRRRCTTPSSGCGTRPIMRIRTTGRAWRCTGVSVPFRPALHRRPRPTGCPLLYCWWRRESV